MYSYSFVLGVVVDFPLFWQISECGYSVFDNVVFCIATNVDGREVLYILVHISCDASTDMLEIESKRSNIPYNPSSSIYLSTQVPNGDKSTKLGSLVVAHRNLPPHLSLSALKNLFSEADDLSFR